MDSPKLCPVKALITYIDETKDKCAERVWTLSGSREVSYVGEYEYNLQMVEGNAMNGRNKQVQIHTLSYQI